MIRLPGEIELHLLAVDGDGLPKRVVTKVSQTSNDLIEGQRIGDGLAATCIPSGIFIKLLRSRVGLGWTHPG